MATSDANAVSLETRVQALPQELIDQIQNEVFTCRTGVRQVSIIKTPADLPAYFFPCDDHTYVRHIQHPDTLSLLRVSKDTRRQFLTSYHRAIFRFPSEGRIEQLVKDIGDEFMALVEKMVIPCFNTLHLAFCEAQWAFGCPRSVEKVKDKIEFVLEKEE